MVNAREINNSILGIFPDILSSKINFILGLLQAIGIVLLFYAFYMITNLIIQRKRSKEVKEISKKLDVLIKKIEKIELKIKK